MTAAGRVLVGELVEERVEVAAVVLPHKRVLDVRRGRVSDRRVPLPRRWSRATARRTARQRELDGGGGAVRRLHEKKTLHAKLLFVCFLAGTTATAGDLCMVRVACTYMVYGPRQPGAVMTPSDSASRLVSPPRPSMSREPLGKKVTLGLSIWRAHRQP